MDAPMLFAVAEPNWLIANTAVEELLQVTPLVKSRVDLSVYVPRAVNCCDVPNGISEI